MRKLSPGFVVDHSPGACLGLLLAALVLAIPGPLGAVDEIGIASELTSMRWTIEDATDRMDQAEMFSDFKSVKLHNSIRKMRKLLNRLSKRMRRAGRGGEPSADTQAEIARLTEFIDHLSDLTAELEDAKSDQDITAARHSLEDMSRALEPMELAVLGSFAVTNESSILSLRQREARRRDTVEGRAESAAAATVPDLVIPKVGFTRHSALLGGKYLAIFPHIKNLNAAGTEKPIIIRITMDKTHACKLDATLGPFEEVRSESPCSYLPESVKGPAKQMKFALTIDATDEIPESQENNNFCVVTYTSTPSNEGTLDCVVAKPGALPGS